MNTLAPSSPTKTFTPGISLALRFAMRELRGGLRGFYVFLACIALGVAAISGVNSVAQSITGGIVEEGRTLLGGDVSFRTVQRRLSDAERAHIDTNAKSVSEAATMRAMGRTVDGSEQTLIELKAVDNAWPLVGKLVTQPADVAERIQSEDGVIVDQILLDRLVLKVGDSLNVGRSNLPILGTINELEERS